VAIGSGSGGTGVLKSTFELDSTLLAEEESLAHRVIARKDGSDTTACLYHGYWCLLGGWFGGQAESQIIFFGAPVLCRCPPMALA